MWKGGFLYSDLIYDNHIVPFAIGLSSGTSLNSSDTYKAFVQMSFYADWIAETIREEGEEVSLDPLACAKRYLKLHPQINNTELFEPSNSVEFVASIYDSSNAVQSMKCVGALIRKDVVVTLAQCASNLIVVFSDRSSISIRDIIIHPNYTDSSLYNNIAILKLVSETSVAPVQIAPFYSKHDKVKLYATENSVGDGLK
uniref:Peptidase S1 domain-containing protein n=1 Tax=Anopheles christyi TaxID=43041 RepID=A0A182KAS0_9DIPT